MRSRKLKRSLLLGAVVATTVFIVGNEPHIRGSEPKFVSFESYPDLDGDWCPWDNTDYPMSSRTAAELQAYAPSRLAAGYQPQAGGGQADAKEPDVPACVTEACAAVSERKPERVIHDPYAGFNVVSVDNVRNEVVLSDEYNFNLYVYDRLANSAASAKTEPKRMVGGLSTNMQFATGLYIDPANGDIYATNNDSLRGLNVFGRNAVGDVKPDRVILSPYGSFGLAGNEARQELLVTIQHDGAVIAYPKMGKGDLDPVRLLQGPHTHMADPHSIVLDAKNHLIYVSNYGTSRVALQGKVGPNGVPRRTNWPAGNIGFFRKEVVLGTGNFGPPSVTVYPDDAGGDVTPLRTIEGPKTQLNWPTGIAVDPEHGEIYVSNEVGDSVNVFSATANGDVAPIRIIKGAKTELRNPSGVFVDVANDEVWVANYGGHSATVYKRTASGDVAPIRVIRSAPKDAPATLISNPFMIAYDTKRDQVIVPNCVGHPRIGMFDRLADKNAAAVRKIEGQNTRLNRTVHGVAYDSIHDEIVVNQNIGQAVLTYRGGATGDEAPIRTIMGPHTEFRDPVYVAVDAVHEEIFVFNMSNAEEVLVFDRMANGDVAPKRKLKSRAGSGAVDPVHNVLVLIGREGIQIYDRLAQGSDKPLRVINGPHAGLHGLSRVTIYPPTGMIVVNATGFGNEDTVGNGKLGDHAFAGVWSVFDNGDVAPRWTIAKGWLKQVRGITIDPKHKTVLLSDKYLNGVLTFSLPEMFDDKGAPQTASLLK